MNNQPYMYIDMNKVNENIKYLSKDKKPCLMVKANQYHVLNNIKPLVDLGYDFFGVSTLDEALTITNQFDVEVLIVTPIEIEDIISNNQSNIHFTIVDIDSLEKVEKNVNIHLNFDTGMGRIGFSPNQITQVIDVIKKRNLSITGVYSHFPCAEDKEYSYLQIKRFKEIIDQLKDADIKPKYIHLQNSLGCINYDIPWCNMVRPGIGIWGYLGSYEEAKDTKLQPTLALYAPIVFEKDYQGYIGYGHLDQVEGIIATIKMGYNDGLIRKLRGYDFKPGKIVGNVCMCQTMLLVPNKNIKVIKIFKESELYNIINYTNMTTYEFLCGLSPRINRIIKGDLWQN